MLLLMILGIKSNTRLKSFEVFQETGIVQIFIALKEHCILSLLLETTPSFYIIKT